MTKAATISHKGVVKEITDNVIRVEIVAQSACSSCHAKTVCGVDSANKIIDVQNWTETYSTGEPVEVVLRESLGFVALLYAYILPFVLLISVLIVLLQITKNEGLSAIVALGVLFPYYFVLYLNRNRLQKKFSFEIIKNYNS